MSVLIYSGLGIVSLWLQLTLAPAVALFGAVPNLLLLTVIVAGVRWQDPWLFIYAAAAGLAMDVFTHGQLGVFGISFFLVSFAARFAGFAIYENSLLTTALLAVPLSLLEGAISLTILELLDPGVPWWLWLFQKIVPVSLYHGVLAPALVPVLDRIERRQRI